MLGLIPSLQNLEANTRFNKRRKISESTHTLQPLSQALISSEMACKSEGYNYGNLIAEANKVNATSSVYVSALLHVVRHCSLCIKHARDTTCLEGDGSMCVDTECGLEGDGSMCGGKEGDGSICVDTECGMEGDGSMCVDTECGLEGDGSMCWGTEYGVEGDV